MSRTRRGFRLAGVSWRVLVAEPVILVVLFAGMVASLVMSGGLFLLLFRRPPSSEDLQFPNYLVALPVLWIGSLATTYCNVVVAVITDRRLRGEDSTVRDGTEVATARLHRIVSWTLLSMAVALLLQVIAERFRLGGVIASRLIGLAWSLATTFVIPVLALEDVGVRDSLKRSTSIFKAKWGETVVAQGTVGLAVFIVALPLIAVVGGLFALSVPVGIVAAVVVLVPVMVISGALDAVVDVALYRYAVDGVVLGAFTAEDLNGSFRPKS